MSIDTMFSMLCEKGISNFFNSREIVHVWVMFYETMQYARSPALCSDGASEDAVVLLPLRLVNFICFN